MGNKTWSGSTQVQDALAAKADDSAVVKKTGAQSIDGVKTFTSSPIIPAPTTNFQAATKKFVVDTVDDALSVDLTPYQPLASKGGVNGYAPLGVDQKVPTANLPSVSFMVADWDDITNKPTFRKYFNLLDYGGVPDGVTDNTEAIQAMVDAAHAAHGTALVPLGIFAYYGSIDVRDYNAFNIEGEGGVPAWVFPPGDSGGVYQMGSVLLYKGDADETESIWLMDSAIGIRVRDVCFAYDNSDFEGNLFRMQKNPEGGGSHPSSTISFEYCQFTGWTLYLFTARSLILCPFFIFGYFHRCSFYGAKYLIRGADTGLSESNEAPDEIVIDHCQFQCFAIGAIYNLYYYWHILNNGFEYWPLETEPNDENAFEPECVIGGDLDYPVHLTYRCNRHWDSQITGPTTVPIRQNANANWRLNLLENFFDQTLEGRPYASFQGPGNFNIRDNIWWRITADSGEDVLIDMGKTSIVKSCGVTSGSAIVTGTGFNYDLVGRSLTLPGGYSVPGGTKVKQINSPTELELTHVVTGTTATISIDFNVAPKSLINIEGNHWTSASQIATKCVSNWEYHQGYNNKQNSTDCWYREVRTKYGQERVGYMGAEAIHLPTMAAAAGQTLGSGCGIVGTDMAGRIIVQAGGSASNTGKLVEITFALPYETSPGPTYSSNHKVPFIQITACEVEGVAGGIHSVDCKPRVVYQPNDRTGFAIAIEVAIPANQYAAWNYTVKGS